MKNSVSTAVTVVITDALEMAGARWYTDSRFGGLAGGAEHALLAGADLLLHSRAVPERVQMEGESDPVLSVDVIETIMKTLERVVDRGRIDEKLREAAAENEALASILSILERSHERVTAMREGLEPRAERAPSGGKVIAFDAYPSVPHVYRSVAEQSIVAAPGARRHRRPRPVRPRAGPAHRVARDGIAAPPGRRRFHRWTDQTVSTLAAHSDRIRIRSGRGRNRAPAHPGWRWRRRRGSFHGGR